MQRSEECLIVREVQHGYVPGREILHRVSLALHAGSLTALIGPNAAGKSTLLKLLLGQQAPWSGTITLQGQPLHQLSSSQRARWISYVPQRGQVNFAFTVREVVEMGRFALRYDPQAVDHALQLCDLRALQSQIFAQLSIGQQQRVLLARAIAQAHPHGRVMLLDEPGSAMDLWHIHQTMHRLQHLATQGLAVLVVVHDLNLALRYADQVVIMKQGSIVHAGPCEQVMTPEHLQAVYDVPLQALHHPALSNRPIMVVVDHKPA